MDQKDQQYAFRNDLENLTERYSQEFDLTYESMIGAMEVHKSWMLHCLNHEHEELDD